MDGYLDGLRWLTVFLLYFKTVVTGKTKMSKMVENLSIEDMPLVEGQKPSTF